MLLNIRFIWLYSEQDRARGQYLNSFLIWLIGCFMPKRRVDLYIMSTFCIADFRVHMSTGGFGLWNFAYPTCTWLAATATFHHQKDRILSWETTFTHPWMCYRGAKIITWFIARTSHFIRKSIWMLQNWLMSRIGTIDHPSMINFMFA